MSSIPRYRVLLSKSTARQSFSSCGCSLLFPSLSVRRRIQCSPLALVDAFNSSPPERAEHALDHCRQQKKQHYRQYHPKRFFYNGDVLSARRRRWVVSCSKPTLSTTIRWSSSSNSSKEFDDDDDDAISCPHHQRLSALRNVGIFAHVDAGKTTVTERMLALSGMVRHPGSVDGGDTVTDYLPAERERGITIQSAAVGFQWCVPPSAPSPAFALEGGRIRGGSAGGGTVSINLIDTPGHVDFSVEVHRSVAVLDGAILVVDAVAGAQAQTETVWRAIRNTDANNNGSSENTNKLVHGSDANKNVSRIHGTHAHEPLPALMFVNKMDREGADFAFAMQSVKSKLRGSNPIPIQIPLYRISSSHRCSNSRDVIVPNHDHGEYIGMVDLVHMRAIIYPTNSESLTVEEAAPTVIPLLGGNTAMNRQQQLHELAPSVLESACDARRELIVQLANVDEIMEDSYLMAMMTQEEGEEERGFCSILETISTEQIQSSLRRMTLARRVMPTMCGAALRGLG